MEKRMLIEKVIQALEAEVQILTQSAKGAQEEAQASDSVPESQLDNRAIEAKRLAEVQAKRAKEAQSKIAIYRNMPIREFKPDEGVDLGALVKVTHSGKTLYFLIAPQGAGVTVEFNGHPVEVITPQSPLGDSLMYANVGEVALINSPKGEQSYQILEIH